MNQLTDSEWELKDMNDFLTILYNLPIKRKIQLLFALQDEPVLFLNFEILFSIISTLKEYFKRGDKKL